MRNRKVAFAVALVVVAGCSGSTAKPTASDPRAAAAEPDVFVAIGADATSGIGLADPVRDAWPQLVYRETFPVSTVFVNAANQAATVRRARADQVALALEQHATVVAIWLDAADTLCTPTTSASAYVGDLTTLVEPVRASHARVLIGNVSRTERCGAAFDDAIDQVARAQGATVVDVAGALRATPAYGPRSSVTKSVSRTVADAFGAAVASR